MLQTFRMQVHKYIPDKLYGFVILPETERQAFFHLGVFDPGRVWSVPQACENCLRKNCSWPETPPPPVLGEWVDSLVDFDGHFQEGRSPKALKVSRISPPTILAGKVDVFDCQRGYGFVVDDSGLSYHLHRSEVLEGRVPLPGQKVVFCAGFRQGRPRACHVRLCL